MRLKSLLALLLMLILLPISTVQAEAYPSTYSPLPSSPTLITHATILTGTGERMDAKLLLLARAKYPKA